MKVPFDRILGFALFALVISFAFVQEGNAQRRDYMTDAEIELVRENQDLDLRIDVLVKMIDRRFLALRLDAGGPKVPAKQSEKWGEPPTGTRLELLTDIKRLLYKATDDIDDVAEHDKDALVQNKVSGKIFPKAVRNLSTAAGRISSTLKTALNSTKDERERGTIMDSIDLCDQIIDAATKLPPEVKKEKN